MSDPDTVVAMLILGALVGAVALAGDDLRARWWAALTRRSL